MWVTCIALAGWREPWEGLGREGEAITYYYKTTSRVKPYDVALWILQLLSDLTALDNSITGNCR